MIKNMQPNNQGFFTLLSMLIAGAIGVTIAVSVLLLAIGFSRTSSTFSQTIQARTAANTCVETALQKIKYQFLFQGTGTLITNGGTCDYQVIVQTAENRLVFATGTVATVIRKVKVTINDLTPRITIVSWQEIP